jgi:hypothetical protein
VPYHANNTASDKQEIAAMAEQRLRSGEVVKTGISLGSALAIAISWSLHKSILWAIIHGIFSWFYVIYYAVTR